MVKNPSYPPFFLSCDWGTSSFRLQLIDAGTGDIIEKTSSDLGIRKVTDWTVKNKNLTSHSICTNHLKDSISLISKKCNQDLTSVPVLVSGMASSSKGIKELSHSNIPFHLNGSDLIIDVEEESPEFPHDLILISGIRHENEVIRGEETQILGLASYNDLNDSICLFPGTHSKHILINHDQVKSFRTFMTGDVFNAVRTATLLKETIKSPAGKMISPAFEEGLTRSTRENLLGSIFDIRTRSLFEKVSPESNFDYLSGLLIGYELGDLKQYSLNRIFLVAEDHLLPYYSTALSKLFPDTGLAHQALAPDIMVKGHVFIIKNVLKASFDES